jgi:hypothetical protein
MATFSVRMVLNILAHSPGALRKKWAGPLQRVSNIMGSDVRARLQAAIREAEAKNLADRRASHAVTAEAERAFKPVRQAAEEIRDELQSIPSIRFTINPESVCVALVDRELWCGYDAELQRFIGEESAHSWFDGERYAERYEWTSADECTDAMIRLCAQYARMARAINEAAVQS